MSELVTGPLVLVVDDEPLVLQLLQDTLEDAGFEVILAKSYEEAVAAVKARADDLAGLVTDVNLGKGPPGWEVAAKARELLPTLPVVYVTGDSSHEWPSTGVPQSVVINKPFAPAQIVVALAGLANQADVPG